MKTGWLAILLILLLNVQWADAQADAFALHPTQPDALLSTAELLEHSLNQDGDNHLHCCHCHGITSLFDAVPAHVHEPLSLPARLTPGGEQTIHQRRQPPEHRPPIA